MKRVTLRALQRKLKLAGKSLEKWQTDYRKVAADAATYRRLYNSQQEHNKCISDERDRKDRLVRTLLDALADKYYPVPTNTTVNMKHRDTAAESSPAQER